MTATRLAGLGLLVGGALIGVPGIALLGALALLVEWLGTLWSRHGLDGVSYERELGRDRAVYGDRVPLRLTVHNRKLLPVPWLRIDDYVTDGLELDGLPIEASNDPGLAVVRTAWALGPYQRATRSGTVRADSRGVWTFEKVRTEVADLFAAETAHAEAQDRATLIVRPRTVPVQVVVPGWASSGARRAPQALPEDPDRFAGVRPFQHGDPLRRIHPRASARLGRPVSRRYEASRHRTVVIVLDVQTVDGPHWLQHYDAELVESLIVAAASLARRHLGEGSSVGLLANGWTYSLSRLAFVPAVGGPGQLGRIEDMLGRLSRTASMPFARALAHLPGRVPADAVIEVVTGRDLAEAVPVLRRMDSSGFEVRCIAMGPQRRSVRQRGRLGGLETASATLAPDWRRSRVLVVGAP